MSTITLSLMRLRDIIIFTGPLPATPVEGQMQMTTQVSAEHTSKKSKRYEVAINGALVELDHPTVSYEDLGQLAHPGHDPQVKFTVTFKHAASEPHKGTLVESESIEVKKNGTMVDVRLTTRS